MARYSSRGSPRPCGLRSRLRETGMSPWGRYGWRAAAAMSLAGTTDVPRDPRGSVATLQIRIPRNGRDDPAAAPYFGRDGLAENHYRISDSTDLHLSWRRPGLSAGVELSVAGHVFERTVPVTAQVPRLPYGSVTREVAVLPALSVSVEPAVRIVPVVREPAEGRDPGTAGAGGEPVASAPTQVRVRTNANAGPLAATILLELPDGWTATPETVLHEFRNRGETAEASFTVTPPAGWRGTARLRAVARAGGREYRTGYRTIEHRDLPLARLWRPAHTTVRSVSVARLDGARIGYVMGVGDEVPAGMEALGATVELLDEAALAALAARASADDGGGIRFDAIVVGTRAYAVRADLLEHNRGLLEYARRGGHLIVLYQTQEYVPSAMAPYPASLPRGAEEVSEEDATVRLIVPDHPALTVSKPDHGSRFPRLDRAARIQVLRRLGRGPTRPWWRPTTRARPPRRVCGSPLRWVRDASRIWPSPSTGSSPMAFPGRTAFCRMFFLDPQLIADSSPKKNRRHSAVVLTLLDWIVVGIYGAVVLTIGFRFAGAPAQA